MTTEKQNYVDNATTKNKKHFGSKTTNYEHILRRFDEEMFYYTQVSTKFAKDLLLVFQSEQPTQFGSTAAVVAAFTEVRRKRKKAGEKRRKKRKKKPDLTPIASSVA